MDKSGTSEDQTTQSESLKATMAEQLRSLATDDMKFDMGVWTTGGPVPFHKDLFVMASPIFESLLRDNYVVSNGNRRTVYVQIEEKIFRIIKRVIYEKSLDEGLDIPDLLKVLDSCLQYCIDQLTTQVARRIKSIMRPVDSIKVLEMARSRELPNLEKFAMESIIKNIEEILLTDDFKTLGCYDVCRIMSEDHVHVQLTEMQIFEAIVRWSEAKAGSSIAVNREKVRYYINQVKECVRFQLMTVVEFDQISELLPEKDAVKWFRHHISHSSLIDKSSLEKSQPRTSQSYQETVPETSLIPENDTSTYIAASAEKLNERKRKSPDVPPEGTDGPVPIRRAKFEPADSSDEELFTVVKKIDSTSTPTFDEMVRRYARNNNKREVSGFQFTNVILEGNYRKMVFENCRSMKLDATCKFIDKPHDMENTPGKHVMDSSFMGFILTFDPLRYIVFDTRGVDIIPDNIWSLEQDVHLKFNGVTFLRMEHARRELKQEDMVVLNYVSVSKKILRNHRMKPTKLALSNCEFSMKHLRGERGKSLESLVLYRAWGEYTLDDIMREYPKLKELVCWKHIPSECDPESLYRVPLSMNLSTAFTVKSSIRKLVLYETELKFSTRNLSSSTTVQDLWLEKCHAAEGGRNNARASDVFHKIFPRLENLVIVEVDNETKSVPNSAHFAISSIMNCVTGKIETIKSIHVVGMKWCNLNREEDEKFLAFLVNETKVEGKPNNFKIDKIDGVWSGVNNDDAIKESVEVDGGYWSQRDQMEFSWYNLNNFYDSSEKFEDYFIQSERFPQPILWG